MSSRRNRRIRQRCCEIFSCHRYGTSTRFAGQKYIRLYKNNVEGNIRPSNLDDRAVVATVVVLESLERYVHVEDLEPHLFLYSYPASVSSGLSSAANHLLKESIHSSWKSSRPTLTFISGCIEACGCALLLGLIPRISTNWMTQCIVSRVL